MNFKIEINSHSYKLSEWKMSNSTRTIDIHTVILHIALIAIMFTKKYRTYKNKFIEINDRCPINQRWKGKKGEINGETHTHTHMMNTMINLDLMMCTRYWVNAFYVNWEKNTYLFRIHLQFANPFQFDVAKE